MDVEESRFPVTRAGGFIGHHLVTYLKSKGFWIHGVDIRNRSTSQVLTTNS